VHPRGQAFRDPRLVGGSAQQPTLARVRHVPGLDEHDRHVGPVEAGQVGAALDAEVARTGREHELALGESGGAATRSVDVVRPAGVQGGEERLRAVCGWVRRPVGVDPEHERRAARVAVPRP
jgi:hypothetical protein